MKPLLVLISAPSGAGKTTLCDRLLQDYPELVYSVSCTTRERRGEEEDGVDYHFVDDETFERLVLENAFLEHAKVHGYQYGTLLSPVRDALKNGQSVIMDIDIAGAAQVRRALQSLKENDPLRSALTDIFIMPPSIEELRRRLIMRGEDDMATINRRIDNAAGEMERAGEYKFKIVNDDIDIAYRELRAILEYCNAVHGPENHDEASESCITRNNCSSHEKCGSHAQTDNLQKECNHEKCKCGRRRSQ